MLVEIVFRRFRQMVLGHSVSGHVSRRRQRLDVSESRVRSRRLLGDSRQLGVVQVLDGGGVLEDDKTVKNTQLTTTKIFKIMIV